LILQEPQTAAKPAQADPRAAAIAARDAERAADKALAAQIREQVRSSITRATQGGGAAVVPVPPPTPSPPREFTIRGPNGEMTTIGMPNSNDIIPQQVVDISIAFFLTMALIIIGLPLARAFARRMDRKSGGTAQIPSEVTASSAISVRQWTRLQSKSNASPRASDSRHACCPSRGTRRRTPFLREPIARLDPDLSALRGERHGEGAPLPWFALDADVTPKQSRQASADR